MPTQTYHLRTVTTNLVRLLEVIASSSEPLTVSQLSKQVHWSLVKVRYHLDFLVRDGFVFRSEQYVGRSPHKRLVWSLSHNTTVELLLRNEWRQDLPEMIYNSLAPKIDKLVGDEDGFAPFNGWNGANWSNYAPFVHNS